MEKIRKYIPWDKSWIIRMGFLDLVRGRCNISNFLEKEQENLSDDLKALWRVCNDWPTNEPFDVGESATVYRFLRFLMWREGIDRGIIKRGSLMHREICDNPDIIYWPVEKLLKLDNGTSQWASISALLGNPSKVDNPPYKLALTYEAREHWKDKMEIQTTDGCIFPSPDGSWVPRKDKTIERQARAYIQILKTGKTNFVPEHSEDYCFARAFGLITPEDAWLKFPSLRGHETNRIKEIERTFWGLLTDRVVYSNDHRIVQAFAMWRQAKGLDYEIKNEKCVNKSWPQFWDFLSYCEKLKK